MNTWAVVPVKPLASAKSRLARRLTPGQRAELMARLLEHTLQVLAGWQVLNGVLLVSSDPRVWQIGLRHGVEILREPDTPGLNLSLERARSEILRRRGNALLVVPADLPFLSRPSLEIVLQAAGQPPLVAIAPDTKRRGTNILYLSPPLIIPFHFGPNSFDLHQQAARQANAAFIQVDSPLLAFDVDLPQDINKLEGSELTHSL